MGRQNVSDGLVEQLRLVNGFDGVSTGTVVAHDHKVLAMGQDRAAIVLNESFEQERVANANWVETRWQFTVEVWIRHNNDVVQARRDSDTYVSNILERLRNNHTLGGSCFTSLATGGRVEDERMVFGGIPYLLETITVRATEDQNA